MKYKREVSTKKYAFIAVLFFAFNLLISTLLLSLRAATEKSNEIHTRIKKVMAYVDRARISRQGSYHFNRSGKFTLSIPNLPYSLQDETLRSTILRGADAKILDVEIQSYRTQKISRSKLQQKRSELENTKKEKSAVQRKLELLRFQKDFFYDSKEHFFQKGRSGSLDKNRRSGQDRPVASYRTMLSFLSNGVQKINEDIAAYDEKRKNLDKRIAELTRDINRYGGSSYAAKKKKKVLLIFEVKKPTEINVEISYINFYVNWKPSYDIRVDLSGKQTEFIGYSEISQRSGEDWKDISLSLSTARPALISYLPELKPLYVAAITPYQSKRYKSTARLGGANSYSRNAEQRTDINQTDALFEKKDEVKVNKETGSVIFNVPKKVDIPSDNSSHRAVLSRNSFPVRFEYITIPRLSPYVYLEAIGKNTLQTPILKGKLNIFLDDNFVGSSYADQILPGEEFELTLSINENIRVKRNLEEMKVESPGTFSSSRKYHYVYTIDLENYNDKEAVVKVLDQIPVTKTDQIEIYDLKFSIPPQSRKKNGLVKWVLKLKPQEKKQISFQYKISLDKDKRLSFYKDSIRSEGSLQDLEKGEMNLNLFNKDKKSAPRMQRKMY